MTDRRLARVGLATALTILLLLAGFRSRAQYMRHMNAHQLLRASSVYHVKADRKGFLWFCTDRGLVKYDGREARFFTRRQGLGDDMVFNIFEDRQGRIWPYCYNGRYCFIDGDSLHTEQNDPWLASLPHGLGFIKFMAQDAAGNLRFGYSSHSIVRVRQGARVETRPQIAELNSLLVYEDDIKLVKDSVAMNVVSRELRLRVQTDLEGLKIFKTDSLLWRLDDVTLTQRTVNDLYLTKDGRLLVSTIRGLDIIQLRTGARQHYLNGVRISSCHPDDIGNFWITTLNNGVYVLHREASQIKKLNGFDGLDFTVVNDGRVVFIRNEVLYDLRPQGDSIIAVPFAAGIPNYYNPLFRSNGWGIFQDTWQKLPRLVSKQGGALRRSPISHVVPDQRLFFKTIYAKGDTDFFIYGAWHLHHYRRIRNELRFLDSMDLPSKVDASCQDPANGDVYLARSGAIYKYDFARNALDTIFASKLLTEPLSMSMMGTSMFIVSDDRDIYELPLQSGARRLKRHELGFSVRSLIPYGPQQLYLSSDDADYLARPGPAGITVQAIRYPFVAPDYERLAFIGGNCLLKIDGQYFYFDTSLFNRHQMLRRVYIKQLVINGQEYRGDSIDIRNTSRLNIRVAVGMLDFSRESPEIRYRLLGPGDTSWQRTKATELAFVLRKAGNYELQFVPADTPDAPLLRLNIVVHTPFLRSALFFILCSVLALALCILGVLGVLRYRRRHFDREMDYLRLEHRAINALLNPHFIFNSINNIQGLINRSDKQDAAEYLAVLSRLIRQNLENLEFNLIPLEKELALIERYVMLQNLRFGGVLHLDIRVADPGLQSVQIPPLLLHTFVENSIVHGFRSGDNPFRIEVDVSMQDEEYLLMIVRDNGAGITNEGTPGHRSMGISFNRKRLARLSEFYKLRQSIALRNLADSGGRGTEVRVVLYAGLNGLLKRREQTAH